LLGSATDCSLPVVSCSGLVEAPGDLQGNVPC